jgi:hypothetical protein
VRLPNHHAPNPRRLVGSPPIRPPALLQCDAPELTEAGHRDSSSIGRIFRKSSGSKANGSAST